MRIGIESGEIVADESETTFATGLAINTAARLQQAAEPGEILLGPAVERLTRGTVVTSAARAAGGARVHRRRRGLAGGLGLRGGRAAAGRLGAVRRPRGGARAAAQHVCPRGAGPAGAPGHGLRRRRASASRVSRGSSWRVSSARPILSGRCLPYGEGVTYWAVAEMVKIAAGITDDDSIDAAAEKLRHCCGDEAVADLLALARGARCGRGRALGVRDRVGGEDVGRRSWPTSSRSCSCSRTSTGPRSRCST